MWSFLAAGRTGRKYIMCESIVADGVLPVVGRRWSLSMRWSFKPVLYKACSWPTYALSIIHVPYLPAFLANGYPTLPQCHPA